MEIQTLLLYTITCCNDNLAPIFGSESNTVVSHKTPVGHFKLYRGETSFCRDDDDDIVQKQGHIASLNFISRS